jgi:hypothetical protein
MVKNVRHQEKGGKKQKAINLRVKIWILGDMRIKNILT